MKKVLAEINKALVPAIQGKISKLALPEGTGKVQQGLDKLKGILGK